MEVVGINWIILLIAIFVVVFLISMLIAMAVVISKARRNRN